MGGHEGLLKTIGQAVEAHGTRGLLLSSGLGSLGLEELGTSGSASGGSLALESQVGLVVGVQLLHHSGVVERVLLGLVVGAHGSSLLTELSLNLVGVDDA